jgi:hypothetical protein
LFIVYRADKRETHKYIYIYNLSVFPCSMDYCGLLVLSLWTTLFGGSMCEATASRPKALSWRRSRWGYGHLALGCQTWALGRPRLLLAPQAATNWRSVCLCARQTKRTRGVWAGCLCARQTKSTRGALVDASVRNIIIFIIINIINNF